ncbi:MAG: hypothetical protein LUD78_00240 [Clostridiales bacterium]|nr:hypothetical protein [Clostridiales bacterium]
MLLLRFFMNNSPFCKRRLFCSIAWFFRLFKQQTPCFTDNVYLARLRGVRVRDGFHADIRCATAVGAGQGKEAPSIEGNTFRYSGGVVFLDPLPFSLQMRYNNSKGKQPVRQ